MSMEPAPMSFRLPACRRSVPGVGLLVTLLLILLVLVPAAGAAGPLPPRAYRCDGDPLTAELIPGAMDDPTIPDPSTSAVPVGGGVLLLWRDQHLQLPRTNNAGPASFSDGRWWWSLEDPTHPRFLQRRSFRDVRSFACEAMS